MLAPTLSSEAVVRTTLEQTLPWVTSLRSCKFLLSTDMVFLKTTFFNFIFIVYTIIEVPIFPHLTHRHPVLTPPSLRRSPHRCLCPWVMHICSLANALNFYHSVPSLLPSDSQLSVCSMYPGLCFYFVHQFILFIRFHI